MPPVDLGLGSNPLLEEVNEGIDSASSVKGLKADHRRKRAGKAASKAKKKKKVNTEDSSSLSVEAVLKTLLGAAFILFVGYKSRLATLDRKSNSCKMTYSRPQYVPLPVRGFRISGDIDGESMGYGYRLLRYVDGKLPVSDREHPSKPRGTPVLFVPGHQGNYQQVRSLGSIAAEGQVSTPGQRLDIFTLDFLEEWSALHASMLWKQAEFLNHAVEAILELYTEDGAASSFAPSVMIVGHSYGGIVARAAFTLSSYRVGSIGDMITLGTPHESPPWMMNYSIRRLYQCTDSIWRWKLPSPSMSFFSPCWIFNTNDYVSLDVNEDLSLPSGASETPPKACSVVSNDGETSDEGCAALPANPANPEISESEVVEAAEQRSKRELGWGGGGIRGVKEGVDATTLLGNTVLISVVGGVKDLMVHPSQCNAEGLGLEGQSVSYTTEALESCGFGVDHAALVWCKQLTSRVVAALSELATMNAAGVGAKERTVKSARVLTSARASAGEDSGFVESLGFKEAAKTGTTWVLVCRSIVSDRSFLLIPAWVLMGGLVLAAVLVRGLAAKTKKDGQLPRPALLLLPAHHMHWQSVKAGTRSLWVYVRAEGWPAVASILIFLAMVVSRVCELNVGVLLSRVLSGAISNLSSLLESIPGGSVVFAWLVKAWVGLDAAVVGILRFLNPFEGAAGALRLPPVKGLMVVYGITLGFMMTFMLLVAVIGAAGTVVRRGLKKSPVPMKTLTRALGSRQGATFFACVVLFAMHVERLSLQPTFRTPTLHGELSVVFLALSVSFYALLTSLALFPSYNSISALYHQRLVLLLYAPAPALLIGPQLAAAAHVYSNPGLQHETFISAGELSLTCLALLPMLLSSWYARRGKGFPSPPSIRSFVADIRAQIEEEALRSKYGGAVPHHRNSGNNARRGGAPSDDSAADLARAALDKPHGHGACGKCLHEDGGKGAVFVETDEGRIAVGGGVTLGPGFRVVACDCPTREPAAPSTWCEFCRCVCPTCGGCKEAAKAARRANAADGWGPGRRGSNGGMDIAEIGPAGIVGVVGVCVVYFGAWGWGMKMMQEPCHCVWGLAVVGVVLCGMDWGVAKEVSMCRR